MAKPSFRCKVLSLKKTKLGESDLIITALRDDGSLLKAIAKGARKPTNPFSTRLELFAVSDCLIAQGRNLHIFSESRCVDAHLPLRSEIDLMAAATPIIESLSLTTHEDLAIPRLFDMSCAALSTIESCPSCYAPSITAAFLLKLLAMLGFKPSFTQCVCCGEDLPINENMGKILFSFQDGGVVCDSCSFDTETIWVDAQCIAWSQAFLMATFDEVRSMNADPSISFAVLQVCHSWFRENLGINLKSLNYLFTCGLF